MLPNQIITSSLLMFAFLILSGSSAIYIKPDYDKDDWRVEVSTPDSSLRKEEKTAESMSPVTENVRTDATTTEVDKAVEPVLEEEEKEDEERSAAYCTWSTPCQWTVCPWTRRLWKFGESARCYNVVNECLCAPQETCTMSPLVNHGSSKNTASWFCRREPFRPKAPVKRPPPPPPPRSDYDRFLRSQFVIYRRKW